MHIQNNQITTPDVYNIPQAEPARSLSLSINKISKKIEAAKSVGNVYAIRREEKREILTQDVSSKLADIVGNMLLMNIENGEPAKAVYFNDNIAPLIAELGYDNINRLTDYGILPDDEQDISYKDLLSGALTFYKEKLNGTVLSKVDLSIIKESPFPRFTKEMKTAANIGMTNFDIRNKLLLVNGIGPSAPISASIADLDELLRLIGQVYALEQNKIRFETLNTGNDEEIKNKNGEARELALKIGLVRILALLQVVQAQILKVGQSEEGNHTQLVDGSANSRHSVNDGGIGGNADEYAVPKLLNISDNLRRALRLVDHEGLRIAGDLRGSLYLGEQGQQIPLLVAD